MSELKFSCPACGQHISCSPAYCDHAIHCPNCRTEIRVPCSANPNLNPVTTASKTPLAISSADGTNGTDKTTPAANEKELHCRCPVCQSKLRIPASAAAQSADIFPAAELVMKSSASLNEPGPAKPAGPADSVPATPPMTEREQKIAAERAARAVSLYPKMKPRLDLVLGEKSPAKSNDVENPPWMKEAA